MNNASSILRSQYIISNVPPNWSVFKADIAVCEHKRSLLALQNVDKDKKLSDEPI